MNTPCNSKGSLVTVIKYLVISVVLLSFKSWGLKERSFLDLFALAKLSRAWLLAEVSWRTVVLDHAPGLCFITRPPDPVYPPAPRGFQSAEATRQRVFMTRLSTE